MSNSKPLDDLRALISQLPNGGSLSVNNNDLPEKEFYENSDFASLYKWLSCWQENTAPKLSEVHICILASSYEEVGEVERVTRFITSAGKGKEPVNLLCKERGTGLRVLEMAPTIPHKMDGLWREEECMAATAFGMEATAAGGDLLGISSFAPGDRAAVVSLIENIEIQQYQKVMNINKGNTLDCDSLDLMRKYGGRELAGIVGSFIAARSRRLPVLAEGWAALGAMSVLASIDTAAIDHIQIASVDCEEQFEIVKSLGKYPIVGPKVSMGPGCGIALAVSAMSPLLHLNDNV